MRLPRYLHQALITLLIFLFLGQWLSLGFLIVLEKLWPELLEVQALFLTNVFPHVLAGCFFLVWHFFKKVQWLRHIIIRSAVCYACAYLFHNSWVLLPLEPHHIFVLYLVSLLAGLLSGMCCGILLYYALRFSSRFDHTLTGPLFYPTKTSFPPFSCRGITLRWRLMMITLFALAGPPLGGMLMFFTTSRYLIDLESLLFFYSYGLLPSLLAGMAFGLWTKWQPAQPLWLLSLRGGVCAGLSCALLAYLFALWQGAETILLLPIFLMAAIPAGIGCAVLTRGVFYWSARRQVPAR
jgi:hypothetical protein